MSKDPELKFIPATGNAVVSFSIGVNDGYGDKQKTYFINIVQFGKGAETTANYCKKGSSVLVKGKLTNRSYETQEGVKKYVTEVVADNFGGVEFLNTKKEGQATQGTIPSDYFGNGDMTPIDDGEDMPF